MTALDRDRRPVGKARSAAEALAGAGEERPLSTIVRREPATPGISGTSGIGSRWTPSFPSLEAPPAEPTAAEWRALAGKCEWSPGGKALLFHPEWPETAAPAEEPVGAAAPGGRDRRDPAGRVR